jgi:protein-tyrosine-phosphatase
LNKEEYLSDEDKLFYGPIATRKILIVCKGNTCRSVIFHSILKKEKRLLNTEVFSAGVDVKEIDMIDNTKKILNQHNTDIAKNKTNKISEYKDMYIDDLIVLDSSLKIPDYIKTKRTIIFDIPDPDHDKDPKNIATKEVKFLNYEDTYQSIRKIINDLDIT